MSVIAFGSCFVCGQVFTFAPDLVPSVPIDPETRLPPDIDPKPGGYERAVKQPLCERCITLANQWREARGDRPYPVLPGAYGSQETL